MARNQSLIEVAEESLLVTGQSRILNLSERRKRCIFSRVPFQ
jgi:hypothetical protein